MGVTVVTNVMDQGAVIDKKKTRAVCIIVTNLIVKMIIDQIKKSGI